MNHNITVILRKLKKTPLHRGVVDVAQSVRASDRHTADAGSIPRCGKGFFARSPLSVQTLLRVSLHPCAITCIDICAHVKDPVVHVKVRWIMETLKHPARTVGWVARLCRSWLSRGRQPEFPMGEIPVGQYSCNNNNNDNNKYKPTFSKRDPELSTTPLSDPNRFQVRGQSKGVAMVTRRPRKLICYFK